MHKKTSQKKRTPLIGILALMLLLLFHNNSKAQSNCINSINLDAVQGLTNLAPNGDVWFSFTGNSDIHGITVTFVPPMGGEPVREIIDTVELYSGTCSILSSEQILTNNQPVNLIMTGVNVTAGNTYYLRVHTSCTSCYSPIKVAVTGTGIYGPSVCDANCNLTCNGGLEILDGAPAYDVSNMSQANCWNIAFDTSDSAWYDLSQYNNQGTPDLFSSNCTPPPPNSFFENMCVPLNQMGTQMPFAGNGYAGIFAHKESYDEYGNPIPNNPAGNYREYIEQDLCVPMVTGRHYRVTAHASLSDSSSHATRLGILLKDDTIQQPMPAQVYTASMPQYETPGFVTNITGWDTLTFIYTSVANEKHIAIGNFRPDSTGYYVYLSNQIHTEKQTALVTTYYKMAYYYLDSVTVVPVDTLLITGKDSICPGGQAVLTASLNGLFPNGTPIDTTGYQVWTSVPYDMSLANDTDKAVITVSPSVTTIYTCTTTDRYGCTYVASFRVVVLQSAAVQIVPVLGASANINCATVDYNIQGDLPNSVHIWSVSAVGIVSDTIPIVTVPWNNQTGNVNCIVVSPDGCLADVTLAVNQCCNIQNANAIYLNNRSATSILNDATLAPYISGTDFTTTNPIVINGVLNADTAFGFVNCQEINPGQNAQINIKSGQTFDFNNSKVAIKCEIMWNGIVIEDNTALLKVRNNSLLQQARAAVTSNNGGVYQIQNSILQNNYKGIVVNSYPLANPSLVRSTDFIMPGTFKPAIPALPSGHTKTVCGIEIADNGGLTIGDDSLPANRNTFRDIFVGVRSKNSVVTVYNSRFFYFNPTVQQVLIVPDAGSAIVAEGARPNFYTPSITVGGLAPNQQCKFDTVRTCLDAKNSTDVYMINNSVLRTRLYAARIQSCGARTVNIQNNIITNASAAFGFNTAVLILECYDAFVNVNNNSISQTNATAGLQVGNAIRVALVSPGTVNLDVSYNAVSRMRTGIWLQNIQGRDKAYVHNNTATFVKAYSAYTNVHYGIRLENCATVTVNENLIQKGNGTPNSISIRDNLRGISIENSQVSKVYSNTCSRMGSGIFGWETCSQSTIACNTFEVCYNGVFFAGGIATGGNCDIGEQVLDPNATPAATGNVWIGNVVSNQEINGSVFQPINWYYDNTLPQNNALGVTTVYNSYNACDVYFPAPSAIAQREMQAGMVIRNIDTVNMSPEQVDQMRRNAFRTLSLNPTWLDLGTPDDTLYQNFYHTWENTDIGLFRDVEMSADTSDEQAVDSLIAFSSGSNLIGQNLNVVYQIYSATWMKGIYEFTPADSALLLNIALYDPVEGGAAVYNARVMLDLPVDYYGINSQRIAQQPQANAAVPVFSMYPNPATNEVTMELEIVEGQTAKVEIRDLHSKLIASHTLAAQQEVYKVNTTALQAGTYVVQVWIDGELAQTEKLVILK